MTTMRKFIVFSIVFCFNIYTGVAQTLQWAKQFGGSQSDIAFSNTIDRNGNSYITGYTDTPSLDFFICKFDTSGTLLWTKTLGGPAFDSATDITVDDDCNIYICGSFSDSVDFDPGPNINQLISHANTDAFLLKLDSVGNFVWVRQLGGGGINDDRSASCVVNGSDIYWCGVFSDTAFYTAENSTMPVAVSLGINNDVFILKLDTGGNFIWIKSIGGTNTVLVNSIALASNGDLIVMGVFSGTCDFNPDTVVGFYLTSLGFSDIYILELDSQGNFINAKQLGGSNLAVGREVKLDNADNIYGIGYFIDTLDADPNAGVLNLISNGLNDVCLFKLNSGGNLIWAKSWGGTGSDLGMSFAIDTANNIYTVGAFINTVDFDPGPGIYNLTSNGGVNTFVSKLDSAGNFIWAKQLDGSNNLGFSITLDVKESIYVAGEFGGLCDFDPSGNSYTLTSSGTDDAYLFKWSQVLTGLQHMNNLAGLNVFPNPFVNNVQISLPEKAIITVSNIAGQVILKAILPAGANAVSLANQPVGAYLLNVQTSKSSSNAVLIKSY